MKKVIAVLLIWMLCGFASWGLTLGDFTYEFPYHGNKGISAFMAAVGPFGLAAALIHDSHHWRVRPLSKKERWEIFHKSTPTLSYEYFEHWDSLY